MYGEGKEFKHKIKPQEFGDFKKNALDIQKYETSVKSIFFEKE
jgi:hypothetical protein